MPKKIGNIRKKSKITVAFVLQEVSVWKTEDLYVLMRSHARFNPVIVIVPCLEVVGSESKTIEYCRERGYDFVFLSNNENVYKCVSPDIIFYQKPYESIYPSQARFYSNLRSVFCYAYYTFHTFKEKWPYEPIFFDWVWQHYFENDSCLDETKPFISNGGNNCVVTGVPMSDVFLHHRNEYINPWKKSNGRKCIIYAPHHSGIRVKDHLQYSTFLDYSDYMLDLALKYQDRIVMAFKPHPSLKYKLEELWGKEQTNEYYQKWQTIENCQLELDNYEGLFIYSDALIHDCSSFTLEYFYAHKPMMYLEKDSHHADNLLSYAKEAYNLHYKGHTKEDIEEFILNVINDIDPKAEEREIFFNKYLLPPDGKKASENIINSILSIS